MTYAKLKKLVDAEKRRGKTLPCTATNENQDDVIISEGEVEGNHYFETQTLQKNGWIRINCYYADGTIDETFSR